MRDPVTKFNQIIRYLIFFPLCCCFYLPLSAQHAIKGTVYQKDTRTTLSGATILLYDEKARIKAQTISDEHGNFLINNVPIGFYRLLVSFMGNRTEMIPVEITTRTRTLAFNFIQLSPSISLSRVEVKADRPLMAIRKDTIEFSASDLPTLPNANMHNLIEKIPGLTMDENGNLSYLGSPIKELFIDGRSVLQNMNSAKRLMEILKADLADKIQISDKKNLSGMTEPGRNEKVLNIIVKAEMRKGVRGSVAGGYGTHDRYNANTTFNMFRKKITVLGDILANNNNTLSDANTNYSVNFLGNNQQGINKILNIGTFTTMEVNKKIKLAVNLKHQEQDITANELQQRENIFQDSSTFYHSNNLKHQNFKRTGGNFFLDIQPDVNNKITITAIVERERQEQHNTRSYNTTGSRMNTLNAGTLSNNDSAINKTLETMVDYSHKFGRTGRVLAFHGEFRQSWLYSYQLNINNNNIFSPFTAADSLNQKVSPKNDIIQLVLGASYSEPIGKNWMASVNYVLRDYNTNNRQNTSDFSDIIHGYLRNDSLTYCFNSKVTNHLVKPSLTYNKGKLMVIGAAGLSLNNMNSDNFTSHQKFTNQTTYVDHALTAVVKIDPYKTLNVSYSGMTIPVEPKQLWPINNNSNPLYVQLGNPDLINSFINSLLFSYFSNSIRGEVFADAMEIRHYRNAFSTTVFTDSIGRQVSMPINVSGNWGALNNIIFGWRLKKPGLTINYSNAFDYSRAMTKFNNLDNVSKKFSFLQSVGVSFTWKKMLEISGKAIMDYKGNMYSLQNNDYNDYIQYTMGLNVNAWLPLDFNIGTNVNYTNNTEARAHFTLFNGWVGRSFLHNKSLLAKFFAFDLLHQNKSIQAYYGNTFRETLQTTNLSQYFMFSLSYSYGRKGSKNPLPQIPR
ncbi:carboxypeptidase-like regulatory domain-containing protein [Chitinophaga sp. HK235]|uniref:carboxypeptidase-like regulatory domain-containing protein n=1 Tax=Chitinophaga sp. HK235 TaxID=2952571 RepID=UPI001BA9ADA5|nr:carboxypeptidase-like regulatory domain-containing protein [Chitinophaga sp. HK235]